MKKRLFAVLMAVCLVFGTCTLFASAAIDAGKYLKGDESALKIATEGTDFNKSLSITAKSGATLPLGTTTLTAENIDDVFTFKSGSSTVKYEGNLDQYITITATVDDSGNVEITDAEQKKTITIYEVATKIDADAPIKYDDYKDSLIKDEKPIYKDADILALIGTRNSVRTKAVMCSLTTGIQIQGTTLDADLSETTEIFVRVERYNGGYTDYSISKEYMIDGIMTGDQVYLSIESAQNTNSPYEFYCWINKLGDVLSTSPTILWTAGSNQDNYIYAVFVENSNYFAIDASLNSLTYKETLQLTTKGAHPSEIEWSSSDNSVLTVENGTVTAVGRGTATITALSNSQTSSVTITVDYSWWQWIIVILLFGWLWY